MKKKVLVALLIILLVAQVFAPGAMAASPGEEAGLQASYQGITPLSTPIAFDIPDVSGAAGTAVTVTLPFTNPGTAFAQFIVYWDAPLTLVPGSISFSGWPNPPGWTTLLPLIPVAGPAGLQWSFAADPNFDDASITLQLEIPAGRDPGPVGGIWVAGGPNTIDDDGVLLGVTSNRGTISVPSPVGGPWWVAFETGDGGTVIPQQTVADNQTATQPADPTRAGYDFLGWHTAAYGGTPFDFNAPITGDTMVFAHWQEEGLPGPWTVSFDTAGGTAIGNQIVANNGTATQPADPSRGQDTFLGWYTAATGGEAFDFDAPIEDNTAVFARWQVFTPGPWTVSFDTAGGTAIANQTVDHNGTATQPADPSRGQDTFLGWYTAATGGEAFDFDALIEDDTTVFARWDVFIPPGPWTVSFNTAGGTAIADQTVDHNDTATQPVDPSRGQDTFLGWFTAASGGEVFDFDAPIVDDTTVFARWRVYGSELHRLYMVGDAHTGDFRPGGYLTRAEAAIILVRTHLLDFERAWTLPPGMTSFDTFSDVRPGSWYYNYIAWAYDAGLVQGFAGEFRPNEPITREEYSVLLVRTLTNLQPTGTIPFLDADDISWWARMHVYNAFSEGLIVGDSDGNFRPQDNIIRAEAAVVMNRMLDRISTWAAFNIADVQNLSNAHVFQDVDPTAWYFPAVLAATNDHYLTRDNGGDIDWKAFRP